eukprot:TRINITY_DN85813_c0_g1_i1.p1 TRINITY_DN85813_c0_g1~~TRINITY_DN85813_c0_g1_i1.p1  ORF type:complete len:645 (-),score=164.02 TRINITY_DN85813_c0_g1_i1:174-2108(-)
MFRLAILCLILVVSLVSADKFDWSTIKTAEELSKVPVNEFFSLTADNLTKFGEMRICDGLTAEQVNNMYNGIEGLTESCLKQMTTSCSGFNGTNMESVPVALWGSLTLECLQNFSDHSCYGIGSKNGQVFSHIDVKMIPHLTPACVKEFYYQAFTDASAEQLAAFSGEQCAQFDYWLVKTINNDAIKGLTEACTSKWDSLPSYGSGTGPCRGITADHWPLLSSDAIHGFIEDCLYSLDYSVFQKATAESIAALNPDSCAGLRSNPVGNMESSAISGFTSECFNKIHRTADYSFQIYPYLGKDVCSHLTPTFFSDGSGYQMYDYFTEECISYWPADAVESLTSRNLGNVVNFGGFCRDMDVIFDKFSEKTGADFQGLLNAIDDKINKLSFPKCYSTLSSSDFNAQGSAKAATFFKSLAPINLAFTISGDFINLEKISDIPQERLMGIRAAQAVYIKGDALGSLKVDDLLHLQFEFFAGIGPYQVGHLSNDVVAELFILEQKNVDDESVFPVLYLPASSIPILKQPQLNAALGTINPVKNMCKEQLKALTMIQLSWLTTDVRNEIKTRINTAQACPENDFKFEDPTKKGKHSTTKESSDTGNKSWKLHAYILIAAFAALAIVLVLAVTCKDPQQAQQATSAYKAMS